MANDTEHGLSAAEARDLIEVAYRRGQRDALSAVLALNPEAAAEVAKWAEKEPDPHGRMPFDVALWVSRVATQLGFEALETEGIDRFVPIKSTPSAAPSVQEGCDTTLSKLGGNKNEG